MDQSEMRCVKHGGKRFHLEPLFTNQSEIRRVKHGGKRFHLERLLLWTNQRSDVLNTVESAFI